MNYLKKTAIYFVFSAFCGFLLLSNAPKTFAQNGTANIDSYTQELEKQLMLEIPAVTENPSHTIIFKDPSGKGVSIIIDGQNYGEIKSPYNLPTLGIGKHTLEFSFKDNEEISQKLEKDIVIIPRPPKVNTPEVVNNRVKLTGSGVAGGVIEMFISGGLANYRKEAEIDINGDWNLQLEEELSSEKYTVVAIARKNGFASKYSEPISFEIKNQQSDDGNQTAITENIAEDVNLEKMGVEDIINYIINNQKLLIATGIVLVIGIVLGIFIKFVFSDNSGKKVEKLLKNSLNIKGIKPTSVKKNEKNEEEVCFSTDDLESIKDKLENGLKDKKNKVEELKTEEKTVTSELENESKEEEKKEKKSESEDKVQAISEKVAEVEKDKPEEEKEPEKEISSDDDEKKSEEKKEEVNNDETDSKEAHNEEEETDKVETVENTKEQRGKIADDGIVIAKKSEEIEPEVKSKEKEIESLELEKNKKEKKGFMSKISSIFKREKKSMKSKLDNVTVVDEKEEKAVAKEEIQEAEDIQEIEEANNDEKEKPVTSSVKKMKKKEVDTDLLDNFLNNLAEEKPKKTKKK